MLAGPFDEDAFRKVIANLMTPATSLEGIQQLKQLAEDHDYLLDLIAASLEDGVFEGLFWSLAYSADANEAERTNLTFLLLRDVLSILLWLRV